MSVMRRSQTQEAGSSLLKSEIILNKPQLLQQLYIY